MTAARASLGTLFTALAEIVDRDALAAAMRAYLGDAIPSSKAPASSASPSPSSAPLSNAPISRMPNARFLLQDLLDDSILGAKSGDKSFPLRVLLSELATRATHADDASAEGAGQTAFTLLCAMNVYFRIEADDEVKMRLGVEISRLYYQFMEEAHPEGLAPVQVSGLVAALLSTELQRVRLDAVDTAGAFDSQSHERAPGADPGNGLIRRPLSFVCRVPHTGMVRVKATVLT